MYRTQVTDLIRHERLRTTEAKAKEVQGMVEKVITLGKKGSLHHRRQAAAVVVGDDAVRKLFGELAERYSDRPGGYTRMYKLGTRKGDAAEMAVVELVG